MVDFKNLSSICELAKANPCFTEASLRWLVFNAAANGLESAIVRVGRRVFLDRVAFNTWLESRRSTPRPE